MNEPRTWVLATMVPTSSSIDAHVVRVPWYPFSSRTLKTRQMDTTTGTNPRLKSRTRKIFRLVLILLDRMMGTGKMTSSMSVMALQADVVKRLATPCRHCGPGSGVTCQ